MIKPSENAISVLIAVLGCLMFWVGSGITCHAPSRIPDDRAILAVIGEAEGEGYAGMLAVASAIRNRGHLDGVYGECAPRVRHKLYSAETYALAQKAWAESASGKDPTHGATHWENTAAFGVPDWARGMVRTAKIGNHEFYREEE